MPATAGRRAVRAAGVLLALAVIVAGGFLWWTAQVMAPMPQALAAMQSGDGVVVESSRWLVFRPQAGTPRAGLVLYPGAKVDPRAYAPPARAIAAAGYVVVVVPMPLHLAVLAPARASDVQDAFPDVQRWAIGGHSLGGAMAARHAARTPSRVHGLLLWAAYPAGRDDLSAAGLASAHKQGLIHRDIKRAEIEASRAQLPAGTQWIEIEGGNHAQFGWYGQQPRDLPATISREQQQREVVTASIALLDAIAVDR